MKTLFQYLLRRQLNLRNTLLMVCVSSIPLYASVVVISNQENLKHILARNDYTVVFAYKKSDLKGKDSILKSKIDRLTKAIEHLSDRPYYQIARVSFVKLVADDDIWQKMFEEDTDEAIAFLIYEQASLVQQDQKVARLLGSPSSQELETFIHTWIGKEIEELVRQYQKDREFVKKQDQDDKDDSNVSINVYADPYYGYSYGYWPWYGPYWSRGWGWGGGYWRHHRHHGGFHSRGSHGGGHRGGGRRR